MLRHTIYLLVSFYFSKIKRIFGIMPNVQLSNGKILVVYFVVHASSRLEIVWIIIAIIIIQCK